METLPKEGVCSECRERVPAQELLRREDNGQLVCPRCSGLIAGEDLSCRYDEGQ